MEEIFKKGDTVENISEDSERYGERAKVIYTDGYAVQVQYPDGYVGKAKTGSDYYKKVTSVVFKAGSKRPYEGQKTGFMNDIVRFAKSMTRSTDDQILIDMGLMTEDGIYTSQAVDAAAQELCEENKSRLVEIATALKKRNKQIKEDSA